MTACLLLTIASHMQACGPSFAGMNSMLLAGARALIPLTHCKQRISPAESPKCLYVVRSNETSIVTTSESKEGDGDMMMIRGIQGPSRNSRIFVEEEYSREL